MTPKHTLLTLLGGVHLAFAALSAANLNVLPPRSSAAALTRWYGALTGTDGGFAFFAPSVGSPSRAVFVMTDAHGRTWTDVLARPANEEVRLRVSSVTTMAAVDDLRDPLAASWAGALFGRYPDARAIVVRVEQHAMPPLDEYRAGARPAWWPVYEISFHHNPEVARAQEP